jgi:hypothetical protein
MRKRYSSSIVVITIASAIFVSLTLGEDDESKTTIAATAKQKELLEKDPFIKKSIAEFERDVRLAEEALRHAKFSCASRSVELYEHYQKVFTMAGDFDKALACKTMIEELEASGMECSRPRPKHTIKSNGHLYAIIREAETWHVAKHRCEQMGGHLAYAKTPAVIAMISRMSVGVDVHLGASDEEKEGEWKWLDGTKYSPRPGLMNNAMTYQHHLMWLDGQQTLDDGFAGHRAYYICEWDK